MEIPRSRGIFQPCPGVWYYPETPQELIDDGTLLTRDDFINGCKLAGQNLGQARYVFNYLIFSLEAAYWDKYDAMGDTFYDLKDPNRSRSDSYYIECQAAHDILAAHDDNEAWLMGFGPKSLDLLRVVLYDTLAVAGEPLPALDRAQ